MMAKYFGLFLTIIVVKILAKAQENCNGTSLTFEETECKTNGKRLEFDCSTISEREPGIGHFKLKTVKNEDNNNCTKNCEEVSTFEIVTNTSDASFAASEWSPCNSTCGLGIKTRIVYCQLSLQTGVTVKLNDSWCEHYSKPIEEGGCYGQGTCDSEEFLSVKPIAESLLTSGTQIPGEIDDLIVIGFRCRSHDQELDRPERFWKPVGIMDDIIYSGPQEESSTLVTTTFDEFSLDLESSQTSTSQVATERDLGDLQENETTTRTYEEQATTTFVLNLDHGENKGSQIGIWYTDNTTSTAKLDQEDLVTYEISRQEVATERDLGDLQENETTT